MRATRLRSFPERAARLALIGALACAGGEIRADTPADGRAVGEASVSSSSSASGSSSRASLDGGSAPSFDSSFDYLYVEANEGSSSGGHAAIRFGTETYHFQNRDGLLVLDREPTRELLHDYALLNNRTVVASRVAVTAADARRLRAAFDHRYHVQQRQLDVLSALAEDRTLLETWLRGERPRVAALGYFAFPDAPGPDASARAPAVEALRARIAARLGPQWLAERRRTALTGLDELCREDPTAWPAPPPRLADDTPPFAVPFARRHADLAAAVAAVDLLEQGARLEPSAVVAPAGPRYWLESRELERLRAGRDRLEDALVRLAGSRREDWGRPFLIGVARLLALDESLARRRLVVLELLPEDGPRLAQRVLVSRLDVVAEMLRYGQAQVEEIRRDWVLRVADDEPLQARLEETVDRVQELEASVRERRDLRLGGGIRVPSRPAPSRSPLPAASDPDAIRAALDRVRQREERVREALVELYRYQLVTRNCVSELFHTLNEALGESPEASRAVLGGRIDGHSDLTFIPFVSARAVDARYRVVDRRVLPSFREMRLSQMRQDESDLWVALRESNTWTARSYRRGQHDSYFVFFTDQGGGAVLLRPVLGAVNLVAATCESLWGLVRLPVDRGDTLLSGLEGALVSLPELAFWNIRKGSNDWVAPRPQPLDE